MQLLLLGRQSVVVFVAFLLYDGGDGSIVGAVLASPRLVLRLSLAGALTRRLRRSPLLFVFVLLLLFVVLLLRFRLFFFLVVIFLIFLLVRLHGGNNSFRGALLAGGRGVLVLLGRLRLLLSVGRNKSLFGWL